MPVIDRVSAIEILDSRGNPTIQVGVALDSGLEASAAVPSGASTGEKEALELRDGDSRRYGGKGVLKAVRNVEEQIAPAVKGLDPTDQKKLDWALIRLDGSRNKSRLGANSVLGVSLAAARCGAAVKRVPLYRHIAQLSGSEGVTLPVPLMNVINGGVHAPNNLDVQEFMIVPFGADTFSDALRMGVEVYHTLRKVLATIGKISGVGDEGGFAPVLTGGSQEALTILAEAIDRSGYQLGTDICLALDIAASGLWDPKKRLYVWHREGKRMSTEDMVGFYEDLLGEFPIVSIEDGLSEKDWTGWDLLTKTLGNKVQLVGDDLFVTNQRIFKRGIEKGVANAILVKVNQIGTLWETLQTIKLAKSNGYAFIISHRSGETEDPFIADLAVGTDAGQIKTGAPARSERVAKYNRLLLIESELGDRARFLGLRAFTGASFRDRRRH